MLPPTTKKLTWKKKKGKSQAQRWFSFLLLNEEKKLQGEEPFSHLYICIHKIMSGKKAARGGSELNNSVPRLLESLTHNSGAIETRQCRKDNSR